MKATVALAFGERAVISPHIGEMDTRRSMEVFRAVQQSLQDLTGANQMHCKLKNHPA